MKENTPKNFVIQLGALIALYVSVSSLLVLIFGIINITFPDEVIAYWQSEGAREGIRISIATLIVFFPTYLVLTRMSNQARRKEEQGKYTGLAKWLVYLSLLVGGGIILGDLVTILLYLLNGEITTRFILKALALLVVVSATFGYYLLDVKAYFKDKEKQSIQYGIGALVLVLVVLVVGFMNIETPQEVREMRLDEQQVNDLRDIQFRIEEYYRVQETLPTSIDSLYSGMKPPQAPTGRAAYQYKIVDETTYELCATFVAPSTTTLSDRSVAPLYTKDNYNWEYQAGEKCFTRVIVEPTAL